MALAVRFVRLRADILTWKTAAVAVVTFAAVLWVLAVAEEFFFRGVLQQLLARGLRSELLGWVAASILFGLVHLGFRQQFPNWQFALLATIAGLFYGRAYIQARSIRVPW